MPVFLTTIADYQKYKVRKNMTKLCCCKCVEQVFGKGVTDGEIGQAKS